ncbi:response regulator transcription factor [Sulfurospirillum sp.]|nr:response regulator transcription factor [Sulfurospirillum sp.]
MVNSKRKILLLEDDELFASTLVDYLEESNFNVDVTNDGEEALNKSYENSYDLYLFDINVPKIDGCELLKSLRDNGIKTPTIFLTSYNDDDTLNNCFENGCDDYIKKPFKVTELVLRINAVLRRTSRVLNKVKISPTTYYDYNNRQVFCNNKKIPLSMKMLQLLELFIENNNKVVLNQEIIDRLWSSYSVHSEGSIRLYITKIRAIVGKEKIQNIKKVGYTISNIIYDE